MAVNQIESRIKTEGSFFSRVRRVVRFSKKNKTYLVKFEFPINSE